MKKIKNINQRYIFKQHEKPKFILKSISNNLKFSKKIRWKSQQKILKFKSKNSITQIKNICIYTNRSRSVNRLGRMSRIFFRKLASNKLLPGIFKYSW